MARTRAVATTPRVTQDMTAMIYRLLAFYSLAGLLPNIPQAADQLPGTDAWAAIVFCGGIVTASLAMIVLATARRSIRPAAGLYAVLTLVFMFIAPRVMIPSDQPDDVWIYGAIGTSVVCAGVAFGGRGAVAYAVPLALGYTLLRSSPAGGSILLRYSLCSGIFAAIGGLSILAVALGMMAAANAADDLAARVHRQELDEGLDRAVGQERARLDQLIHDDVMTTLVTAANAPDPPSVAATAELAGLTLAKIIELQRGTLAHGVLSGEMFIRLAADTALRVSPEVSFSLEGGGAHLATVRLPTAAAEVMLSAMREAVRNAVRHSGARDVEVRCSISPADDGRDRLVLQVSDDGVGFDPHEVPSNRLGIRLSMTDSLNTVGATCELRSAPGAGTQVEMIRLCERDAVQSSPSPQRKPEDGPTLPAEFPVRRMILVTWGVVVVEIAIGFVNLDRLANVPTVMAMILLCPLVAVVLHTGDELRLQARSALLAVVLTAAVVGLGAFATPTGQLPDIALWQQFPIQLVLVTLIIRRRAAFALVGLCAVWTANAVWSLHSRFGWAWFGAASFGATAFVIMAVLVNRVLQTIARRQQVLREQERAAIDTSVRRHVALVQRSLWISDLTAEASSTLTTIAGLDGHVPDGLRAEALLVEATLREALSARNVMNEALADLTEAARRRGVSITFVDSRSSPVTNEVGRAVMAEIRDRLESESVSRLVVRLAPDRGPSAVSVVMEDSQRTSLTVIDPAGARESRMLPRHD